MKASSKIIIICLIMTLLISLCARIIVTVLLDNVKKEEYNTFSKIVSDIREKYPDVSEEEIIGILNSESADSETTGLLRSYGITDNDWIAVNNTRTSFSVSVCAGVICLASGLCLTSVILIYIVRQKKKIKELTRYVHMINEGKYDLYPEKNSEEETSVLQNEIYKTTVVLREKSEKAIKARIQLKDSISDISHQLKTPLTSVTLMLDNLNDDLPLQLRRNFMRDIKTQTNHISFLIRSLLTLSRLDADVIDFHKEAIPLKPLLDSCISHTEIMAELRGVTVCVIADEKCSALCDKKWTAEAITNIVKNCIEHTPSGGNVCITAQENKLYTRITVRDSGCGISREDLPHIFDRFYRAKNSDENSVGIGLSLTKAIIEKQGGYISAASGQGAGSEFVIRFPAHD